MRENLWVLCLSGLVVAGCAAPRQQTPEGRLAQAQRLEAERQGAEKEVQRWAEAMQRKLGMPEDKEVQRLKQETEAKRLVKEQEAKAEAAARAAQEKRRAEEEARRERELETKRRAQERKSKEEQAQRELKEQQEAQQEVQRVQNQRALALEYQLEEAWRQQQRKIEAAQKAAETKRKQLEADTRRAELVRQVQMDAQARAEEERIQRQNQEATTTERRLQAAWKVQQVRQEAEKRRVVVETKRQPELPQEATAAASTVVSPAEAEAEEEKEISREEEVALPVPSVRGRVVSAREVAQEVYRLKIGDEIELSVWSHPEMSRSAPIREDGTFSYPLIGSVRGAARTLREIEQEVQRRLDRDYIVNPQVTARLVGLKFSVLGEVERPGSYPIEGKMDLLTAISLAGGVNKFGSSRVEIIRERGKERITIRANVDAILKGKEPNIDVLPNDTLYVRRRLF